MTQKNHEKARNNLLARREELKLNARSRPTPAIAQLCICFYYLFQKPDRGVIRITRNK